MAGLPPDESFFRCLPKKRLGWDGKRKRQGNGLPVFPLTLLLVQRFGSISENP